MEPKQILSSLIHMKLTKVICLTRLHYKTSLSYLPQDTPEPEWGPEGPSASQKGYKLGWKLNISS